MKNVDQFSYANIVGFIEEQREKRISKQKEIAQRVDQAKIWVSLGMDPNMVASIIGINAASMANLFGTIQYQPYKEKKMPEVTEKSLEQLVHYGADLLKSVKTKVKLTKDDLQSDSIGKSEAILNEKGLTKIEKELEKLNEEDELKKELDELVQVTAILTLDRHFSEYEKIAQNNDKELNVESEEILDLSETPVLQETTRTLNKINNMKGGDKIIQTALVSNAITEKYKDTLYYKMMSSMTKLEPTVKMDKTLEEEEEKKKKKTQKVTL